MKRTAYVLGPGETEPPESIRNAWAEVIQTSRLYASKMVPGAIGHEVYESIIAETRSATVMFGTPEPTPASRISDPNTRSRALRTLARATTCTTSAPESAQTCSVRLRGSGALRRSSKASSSSWSSTSGCPSPEWEGQEMVGPLRRDRRGGQRGPRRADPVPDGAPSDPLAVARTAGTGPPTQAGVVAEPAWAPTGRTGRRPPVGPVLPVGAARKRETSPARLTC